MLWFNAGKGFGFISTEDEERVRVAESAFRPGEVPQGRCAGREVFFDVHGEGDERHATNVRFAPAADSRRARRRGSSTRR
jgi:cold shock CspA family protein